MRTFNPYALPANYDYDVKRMTRAVKTKKWANTYVNNLSRTADRLTTANIDNRQVIGGMLHNAYGVNMGGQICERLTDADLAKIKSNIIRAVYS